MLFVADTHVVAVNVPDQDALLARVAEQLAAGEGFALATINLDHLVKLRRDPAFAAAYAAQDLVVADGNPVVWLSRLAGRRVSLVPGSDVVLPLARVAAEAGVGVALVGSTEAALAAAAIAMQRSIPGLRIVAQIAPAMGFDPDGPVAAGVLEAVRASGARLVLVALGAPKQERFAARGRVLLPGVGFAGVGAGLDFLAGTQRRAPGWVRILAMEWLWRLLWDPSRLARRYAACGMILPGEVLRAQSLRRRNGPAQRYSISLDGRPRERFQR